MFFYTFFLILGFIGFLFTLFEVSKDDTLFIRKNVSLDNLFTLAFFCVGVGLLFARLFYVSFHFSLLYVNPLAFLLVWYYPGLSFPGGLLAAAIFLLLYARRRKMPLGHTFDFFGIALLCAMPFGYVANMFIEPFHPFKHIFLPLVVALLYGIGVGVLLPRSHRHELKPGTLGTSSILVISFVTFLTSILNSINAGKFSVSLTDIVSLVTFLIAFIFFIKQEYIFSKVKK